jgi:hypothetical protein
MSTSKKKIEMTFSCDQDWNDMKLSGQGRHCEICNKAVFDFSDKAIDQIVSSGNGELCGMFRVEQIEPDLHSIEVPFSLRTTLITLGAVLGLELSHVHGQELDQKPKIENVTKDSARTVTTALDGKLEDKAVQSQDCANTKPRIKKKYYFTKRFPFIVKRSTRTVGRFRH